MQSQQQLMVSNVIEFFTSSKEQHILYSNAGAYQRVALKYETMMNVKGSGYTLDYYYASIITAVKHFSVQAPSVAS